MTTGRYIIIPREVKIIIGSLLLFVSVFSVMTNTYFFQVQIGRGLIFASILLLELANTINE